MAVIPADAGEEDAEFSLEVSILKAVDENGEEILVTIDDDDELDRVYEYYQQIMEAEEEKE